jgi:Bacteriophage tail sheath protein
VLPLALSTWGARTLAATDTEWRYISVRRFFTTVEESVKRSTAWVVFEPNDAKTWVKVRAMIENYLMTKCRDGALMGAKTTGAFFVHCGLGTTMTAQDILDGRLTVEVGMAVVRPAEFIVLRFSPKVQTAEWNELEMLRAGDPGPKPELANALHLSSATEGLPLCQFWL